MNGPNEELARALAGRYEIERELGRGGMAVVYLARDIRHRRHVAVKVLRPELSNALGGERFVREIDVASRLTHPHILPLLDSGDAEGILYYVMPYVAGESLRQKLERERQLPIEEAVSIARQIASAIDYAHSEGVVHRDIKPENILLVAGEVLVADFGLARALDTAASTPLTESGIAVGTPAYMSPEQAAGDRHVDGRSDVYSLACTLFEMIAGVPPFRGATVQALITHHISTPAPSLCRERQSCPEHLDLAVHRGLAKAPADRFRTAGDLVRAAEGHASGGHEAGLAPAARAPRRLNRRWAIAAGIVVLLGAATVLAMSTYTHYFASADDDLVAVLPFRVTANDPSVSDLRDGMMELLHDRFPRAVSVAAVRNAWQRAGGRPDSDLPQEQNLKVALSLRAGKLVEGSVLRTPQGIKMTATLVEATSGAERASASAEGPPSSYPALVDTIANQLLAEQAGEAKHLYLLQQLPTAAVSAYVLGKRSYRAGKYDEAVTHFERALDLSRVAGGDSRFGFAALGLVEASNYEQLRTETAERGLRVAWAVRDQFNEGDRAYLEASAGPVYPRVTTRIAQLRAWDHALNVLQDAPEAYYQFGDLLFQFGRGVQWDDALGLARKSLEQAVGRDSSFVPALQRLAELSIVDGHLDQAEQLLRKIPDGDTATDRAGFLEWRLAVARGDERKLSDLRRRLSELSQKSAREIWLVTQLEGISMADSRRALDALRERAARRADRATLAAGEYLLAMNEGRPSDGLVALRRSIPEDEAYFTPVILSQIVRDAIFGEGDGAAAVDATNQMSSMLRNVPDNTSATPIDLAAEYVQRCALEEWRLAHLNSDPSAATVARLNTILPTILPERFGGTNTAVAGDEAVCPTAIQAWAATLQHRPDARPLLDRLDTTMAHGPQDVDGTIGNLLVARLRLAQGDTASALRALQRRQYDVDGLFYLAVSLRQEGQLAAARGDRKTAIRAYQHYLALRAAPEPALRREADEVRAALGALQVIARVEGCSPDANQEVRCSPVAEHQQHDALHGSERSPHSRLSLSPARAAATRRSRRSPKQGRTA